MIPTPLVITLIYGTLYVGDYFSFQDFAEESEPMFLPTMNRFNVLRDT